MKVRVNLYNILEVCSNTNLRIPGEMVTFLTLEVLGSNIYRYAS
jgi:hypothetical protein